MDAFTLATLQLVSSKDNSRECACGCGRLTANKWFEPSCYRKSLIKQNVLAVFRIKKNRGIITASEYENLKKKAGELWAEQGPLEKEELREQLEAHLEKSRAKKKVY